MGYGNSLSYLSSYKFSILTTRIIVIIRGIISINTPFNTLRKHAYIFLTPFNPTFI